MDRIYYMTVYSRKLLHSSKPLRPAEPPFEGQNDGKIWDWEMWTRLSARDK